jgi:hypothetical protein
MSAPVMACMLAAAAFHHLPPRVLPSIQAVEGGRVGMVSMNRNTTADLGLMQVNTIWVYPLARATRLPTSTVFTRLRDDACFNIYAAAAIMRVYLHEARGNVMTAIGYYHSHTPTLSADYQQKVIDAAMNLYAHPSPVTKASPAPPAPR